MSDEHYISMNQSQKRKNSQTNRSMQLSLSSEMALTARSRIAIVYAAIWGFCGATTIDDKNKNLFENNLKICVQKHLRAANIFFPIDFSIFECVLNLKDAQLMPPTCNNDALFSTINNKFLPKQLQDTMILAEYVASKNFYSNNSNNEKLVFKSASMRALSEITRLLIATGSDVLLLGEKKSGKTWLINNILNDLKSNCESSSKTTKIRTSKLIEFFALDGSVGADEEGDIFVKNFELMKATLNSFIEMHSSKFDSSSSKYNSDDVYENNINNTCFEEKPQVSGCLNVFTFLLLSFFLCTLFVYYFVFNFIML
jgi:hypothetical protein